MVELFAIGAQNSTAFARVQGTDYTPDETSAHLGPWLGGTGNGGRFVQLPASYALGVAGGYFPEGLLYSNSNNGSSWGTDLNGFIDACNTANVPGIIDQNVSPTSIGAKHIYNGLYGVAVAGGKPIITSPARNTCRFSLYRRDVTIRGIKFKDFGWIFRNSRLAVPLTLAGSVDITPYLSGASDIWNNAKPTTGFPTTFVQRCAEIDFVSGSGNITQITVYRRPVNGLPPSGTIDHDDVTQADTWAGWMPLFEGYPSSFPTILSSTVTSATPASLASAINTGSATHNFVAEAIGQKVIISCTADYKEPLALKIDVTNTLVVSYKCRLAGLDISCCEFENCNVVQSGHCETSALGDIKFLWNSGVGCWSTMAYAHTRASTMRVTNNNWGDATGSRAMPSASNTSGQNSIIFTGNNYPGLMRFNSNDIIVEHNYFHDVHSSAQIDTNNSAVPIDIRSVATDAILDNINVVVGQIKVRWNKIVSVKCLVPAIDANALYMKPRGAHVENNYTEDTGASGVSGIFKAEASGFLIKENLSHKGMPQLIVRGNIFRNMPMGRPVVKLDNHQDILFEYNDFENWRNYIGTTLQTDPAASGLVRITEKVKKIVVRSNRMYNINLGGQQFAVSFHNLAMNGVGSEFEFSNINIQNDGSVDYPAYTGNTLVFRMNIGTGSLASPSTYFAAATMGRLNLLDASGAVVGEAKLRYTNTTLDVISPANATLLPYEDYEPET